MGINIGLYYYVSKQRATGNTLLYGVVIAISRSRKGQDIGSITITGS
jgi:hypothetical protein